MAEKDDLLDQKVNVDTPPQIKTLLSCGALEGMSLSSSCQTCLMSFASDDFLTPEQHTKYHVTGCNFECQFCYMGFDRGERLTIHMKNHHEGIYKYKCTLCTQNFSTSFMFVQHLICKKHHPVFHKKVLQKFGMIGRKKMARTSKIINKIWMKFCKQMRNKEMKKIEEQFYKVKINTKECEPEKDKMSKNWTEICDKMEDAAMEEGFEMITSEYKNKNVCVFCTAEFESFKMLKTHQQRYFSRMQPPDLILYTCPLCYVSLDTNPLAFKTHIKMHAKNTVKNSCMFCFEKFKFKKNLAQHLKEKVPCKLKQFTCPSCTNFVTFSHSQLILHFNLEGHEPRHDPYEMMDVKVWESIMTEDPEETGKIRRLQCPMCFEVLRNLSDFKIHQQVHEGTEKFECKFCFDGFKTKKELENHYANKKEKYKCHIDKCNYESDEHEKFLEHVKDKEHFSGSKLQLIATQMPKEDEQNDYNRPNNPNKVKCHICEYCFDTDRALKIHHDLHISGFPYECPYCLMGFFAKDTMITHSKIHQSHECCHFQCISCSYEFEDVEDFIKHLDYTKHHTQMGNSVFGLLMNMDDFERKIIKPDNLDLVHGWRALIDKQVKIPIPRFRSNSEESEIEIINLEDILEQDDMNTVEEHITEQDDTNTVEEGNPHQDDKNTVGEGILQQDDFNIVGEGNHQQDDTDTVEEVISQQDGQTPVEEGIPEQDDMNNFVEDIPQFDNMSTVESTSQRCDIM